MDGNGKRNRAISQKNPTNRNLSAPGIVPAKDKVESKLPQQTKKEKAPTPEQKVAKKKSEKIKHHNIEVLDTNVPINNWRVMRDLIRAGNTVVLPMTLIKELDKLKTIERTRRDAMKALAEIDRLETEGNPFLIIEPGMIFTRMNLDKTNPDHQIIATLNYVAYHASKPGDKYFGFDAIKMITDDYTVKILAREVNQKVKVVVEPYLNNRVKIEDKDLDIPMFYVDDNEIIKEKGEFVFLAEGKLKDIADGSAIVGYSNKKFAECGEFAAVRRRDFFVIINENISAFGVSRMDLKAKKNWGQIIALYYLLNPKISCAFLHGATGSGKTLLALAAGMELKRQGVYPKIVVYRIPESAYGDNSPALPGDVGQKIGPWTEPILQALTKLLAINNSAKIKHQEDSLESDIDYCADKKKKQRNQEKKANAIQAKNGNGNGNGNSQQRVSALRVFVDDLFEKNGVEIKVLDYVRGITLDDAFIIVDDSQNLNKKNIKDVITRAGKNSKIIFTGDLNQIDNRYIDKESSGLSHAIIKMKELPFVGIVSLPVTVRSQLAAAADKLL